MHRFYRFKIEPDLLGGFQLIRNWGRIGTFGQVKIEYFSDNRAALKRCRCLQAQKIARGYVPVAPAKAL